MQNVDNIWNADDELNEDQLRDYLNNKLSQEEAHNIEKKMADSAFINDGVEGLQQFSSAEKINAFTSQINEDLHHKLNTKKTRDKKNIQNFSWEIITVIAVLLLCILGYVFIEMMHK